MFTKVLVANRGEIAVRIIRALRDLGVESVAVYSTADANAMHRHLADEAICIGTAPSKDSYLNQNNILMAAKATGCQAIHPGFGFLSENAEFAKRCDDEGLTFIGPSADVIQMMGDKSTAKHQMQLAGVPTVPGSKDLIETVEQGLQMAEEMGFPVIVKATAGGGGRGMRIVHALDQFESAYKSARMEAGKAFGNDGVYMEKYLINPRHIEIQILADHYGNVIHLGERDCSMQRNNQKVIEEALSPKLTNEIRMEMGKVAVQGAKQVGYCNAGTIEFLLDETGQFFFMEMNTRVQVEHPITEQVTGVDIVKAQIEIAAGLPMELKQEDVLFKGHAIECRINAENPFQNFRPSPGKIKLVHMPAGPGIRVDSAVFTGYEIPAHYDSMIGKIIAYGNDRKSCIDRMRRALGELVIEGIDTNTDFLLELINHQNFIEGDYHTGFLESYLKERMSHVESAI